MKNIKKLFSILLALSMIWTAMPVMAADIHTDDPAGDQVLLNALSEQEADLQELLDLLHQESLLFQDAGAAPASRQEMTLFDSEEAFDCAITLPQLYDGMTLDEIFYGITVDCEGAVLYNAAMQGGLMDSYDQYFSELVNWLGIGLRCEQAPERVTVSGTEIPLVDELSAQMTQLVGHTDFAFYQESDGTLGIYLYMMKPEEDGPAIEIAYDAPTDGMSASALKPSVTTTQSQRLALTDCSFISNNGGYTSVYIPGTTASVMLQYDNVESLPSSLTVNGEAIKIETNAIAFMLYGSDSTMAFYSEQQLWINVMVEGFIPGKAVSVVYPPLTRGMTAQEVMLTLDVDPEGSVKSCSFTTGFLDGNDDMPAYIPGVTPWLMFEVDGTISSATVNGDSVPVLEQFTDYPAYMQAGESFAINIDLLGEYVIAVYVLEDIDCPTCGENGQLCRGCGLVCTECETPVCPGCLLCEDCIIPLQCESCGGCGICFLLKDDLSGCSNCEEMTFTVEFVTGRDSVELEPVTAAYGSKLQQPVVPADEGQIVGSWHNDGGNQWYFRSDTVKDDLTLYAIWVPETCTVTFDGGAHDIGLEEVTVPYGETMRAPAVSTEGQMVLKWLDDSGSVWNFRTDAVTCDMTLHAYWIDEYYEVSFDMGDHEVELEPVSVRYGSLLEKPVVEPDNGYVVVKWYSDSYYHNEWRFLTQTVTRDRTLYAEWGQICSNCGNAGTICSGCGSYCDKCARVCSKNADYCSECGLICQGCGWCKECNEAHGYRVCSNCGGCSSSCYVAEDLSKCSFCFSERYPVHFNMNGHGTQIADAYVYYGSTVDYPDDPQAEGFLFKGWCADSECNDLFYSNTPIIGEVTLYARWEQACPNCGQDGVICSGCGEYCSSCATICRECHAKCSGCSLICPNCQWCADCSEAGGYIFCEKCGGCEDCYAVAADGSKCSNCTALYTVRFAMCDHGNGIASVYVFDGDLLTLPEEPTADGFNFLGWYTDSEYYTRFDSSTPVTESFTLYALWEDAAAPCTHAAPQHHEAVDSTCTASGTAEYWHCSTCGGNFAEESCETLLENISRPLAEHTPNEAVRENEVDASCTAAGSYD
ncbi:MAG: InlB B-repeat-containing protein, partial [Firmicutes bacterium]|nr:InlB B-repeat-containing protein [Bacillota bacterium]